MPRTPKKKQTNNQSLSSTDTTPVLETRPALDQSQKDMLDLLNNLKHKNTDHIEHETDVLKSINEQLQIIEYISKQLRPEMLRNIETSVNKCEESDQYESVFKWSEQIVCTLKEKPYNLTDAHNAQHMPDSMEADTPIPTLKTCRKLLDSIVSMLKSKWKGERQCGYPTLKSGNRTSSTSKKLVKSLPKYETYIIKTLWSRWSILENKTDRIRDQKELQKILHGTQAVFGGVLDALQLEQAPKGQVMSSRQCRPSSKTSSIAVVETVTTKPDDLLLVSDEKLIVIVTTVAQIEADDRTPEIMQSTQFTITVFEPPHPTTSIASAQTTIKHFKDTSMIGMTELSAPSDPPTSNNSTALTGNPKWLPMKHRLAENGVLMANGLHISLPVHRAEFQFGVGNFGPVEFAFDGNFRPIALKRLTQSGRIDPGRADSILRVLDEFSQQESVRASLNLLITTGAQDMCGFSFCHAPLCDFNLSEYVARMVASTQVKGFAGQALDVMHQIVQGLGALHLAHTPIVHGNLKPSNVLVTGEGRVKLADFGISMYLYDGPESISTSDRIWWANENNSWLKVLNTYSCTTMSDIYSCGMLLLYVFSGGRLPSIASGFLAHEALTPENVAMQPELYQLLEHMLDPDPMHRPAIIEVHNHINFWSVLQRSAFLLRCTAMVNTDNAPFLVDRTVSLAFCATLQQCWTKSKSTLIGLNIVLQRCSLQIEAAFGAMDVSVDSPLSVLKLLARCKHTDADRFNRLALECGGDHPQLACVLYGALLTTHWFEHEQFRQFSPFADWDPNSAVTK